MKIFPAIDLYEGKAVRLLKGDYDRMTVYNDVPLAVARDFLSSGADSIHMVDLEGARDGTTPNLSVVKEVVKETGLFVEIGGGIRDLKTVEQYLSIGVGRVILGTAAVKDRPFLQRAAELYGEKIAVGADVKDGEIAVKGWVEKTGVTLSDFLKDMESLGIGNVICTDISRDGAMKGTNLALYRSLTETYSIPITASGGVSNLEDVIALKEMGMYGAIIGKAYYTGAISLREAIEAAK